MAILGVQEIRGHVARTRIAGAPAHVKGVINLRGGILPIIDLRILYGHLDPAYDAHTAPIIVDVGSRRVASRRVGVVVDSVADVHNVAAADIRPAPECTSLMAASHVRGIAALGQGDQARLLILMDPARMLSDADLADPLEPRA